VILYYKQTQLLLSLWKCDMYMCLVSMYVCIGRFDDTVIEERRQCSEDLLQFSANIPALYNSQHVQDFFKVFSLTHVLCMCACIIPDRILTAFFFFFSQGGEVHDGSELIGPAEPFSDFLADSLSDCSSDGTFL